MFVQYGRDYVGGGNEYSVLGYKEARPDRDECSVVLLRDDWENGMAELGVFAIARLRGVASWRCLTSERAWAVHAFKRPDEFVEEVPGGIFRGCLEPSRACDR